MEVVSSPVPENDGRYNVAVPWKEKRLRLPNNQQVVESRLGSAERNQKKKDLSRRSIRRLLTHMLKRGIFAKFLRVKHHP